MSFKIAIASDHAGFELKDYICDKLLKSPQIQIKDLGTDSKDSVDYPEFGNILADFITNNPNYYGIAVCGSGVGISIALNRHKKIRCALCHNEQYAELARKHNDANVIALGARMITKEQAINCIEKFINTDFENGRHLRRVKQLN